MILVKHHNEGNLEPYFYFALESYVLNALLKDDETYFFTWKIKGIVSGKNQVIENEINFKYVNDEKIKFFRRPTGGGSVYADENNTMFTMITKRSKENFSFKTYLTKLIDAFKEVGVNLEFSGRNDLLLEGKKVSGNAFLQNKNGMLMHGTLMYDLDIETMVRALNPPDEKLISKGISSVRSRVNNLKPYLNGMTQDELILHLEKSLCDKVYEISPEEVEMLNEAAKYYQTTKFLYQDQPGYTRVFKKRFSWGGFELRLDIKDGIIENAKINGDFFELKEDLEPFETQLKGVKWHYPDVIQAFEINGITNYLLGSELSDFEELFKDAFLNM